MSIERSTRLLLGLNALLTASLLWVHLTGPSTFLQSADAGQYRSTRSTSAPPSGTTLTGVAGSSTRQRKQMIDELKLLSQAVASFEHAVTSGAMRVHVENVDAMQLDFDYDRLAKAIHARGE